MDDTISRQAAIDEAEEWIKTYNSGRGGQREQDAIKHVISGIKKLPPAQPIRHGKWIYVKGSNGKDYRKCSECLHTQDITGLLNYCPCCGAKMDEDASKCEELEINPCRGCEDYDGKGGCLSNGGCAIKKMEAEDD